ncbi:pimeloyl-ACP methyl ester esterase BioH [Rheinheimera maricola]|uniref:Pimeloyl-[acyl-carrier protein] methyl ester esterase n=1 Tax=Rheinheimera maricola TaxID=2793282 RepID=A0ABS7XEY3_9GAMM|nr:pimeloyl-ACP methyl ester esterase BioH [Rheinheimera maricola]MBZ9613694.1 pimeloyl-ACP methyl ester esterase BioH [Rheinheimera maricola]
MRSDKPTLVLLHGWGVNQGVWQSITAHLDDSVVVITTDLPGFGNSRTYPQPYQLDAVVEQLAAQIPSNSYVCGWSLGGLLAIALAHRYPDKVQQLGLVASSPCFMAQPAWPGMAVAVLQQFSKALSENLPLTIERFLAIQAMGSSSARNDIKLLKQAILAYPMPEAAAIDGALQLLQCDLRVEFAALRQPVAGFYGRLDSLIPVAVVELLQKLQPQARFTLAAKASHAPFISHPDEFIQWLHCWLGLPDSQ